MVHCVIPERGDQLVPQFGLHPGGNLLVEAPGALDVGREAIERRGVLGQVAVHQQQGLDVEVGKSLLEPVFLRKQCLQDSVPMLGQ